MKLYGLKNCDTCKKALKALETAGQSVTFVDIRAEADLKTLVPKFQVNTCHGCLIGFTGLIRHESGKAKAQDLA